MKQIHKQLLTLAAATLMLPLLAAAKPKAPNVLDISRTISDESIIFPETFETNTQKLLEGWYMQNYTATDDRYNRLPDVPVTDQEIIARLQAIPAIIELPFNPIVRQYIERYTKNGRPQVAAILGLSNYYLPIFEQALEQEGLPLELKYLPMIESSLDPNAVSKHGATGLWQFVLAAAKGLGLEVNSLVDERRDPYLSSATAARFLKDLYATYNDWSLAIAAYNCGPGTVNKAIRRAGGDPKTHNFWSIYNYLPAETRGYVPMFIAANYVMNYHKQHNISPVLATKPLITDTVGITTRVHFDQISNVLNIPIEELRVLNPQFRADIIPGRPDAPYFLILPSQQIHAYIMSQAEILAYNADKYKRQVTAETGQPAEAEPAPVVETPDEAANYEQEMAEVQPAAPASAPAGSKILKHKVQPQESLASIAKQYGVQPEQIMEWNSLRRTSVRTGTILKIITGGETQPVVAQQTAQQTAPERQRTTTQRTPPAQPAQEAPAPTTKAKTAKTNSTKHTPQPAPQKKDRKTKKQRTAKEQKPAKPTTVSVREGDSLERIARRQGVSVDELRRANNLSGANPIIQPGQKLKMPKSKTENQKKTGSKSKKRRR